MIGRWKTRGLPGAAATKKRVAAQLAIETDQARCYAILEAEFIAIFADYAEGRIASV